MDEDLVIRYIIPRGTIIMFGIQPHERNISLKLCAGTADLEIDVQNGSILVHLPLNREYVYPVWMCLSPILIARTGCDLLFQGNHYVIGAAVQIESITKKVFFHSLIENTSVFGFGPNVRLLVSAIDSETKVSMQRICRHPKIFTNETSSKNHVVTLGSSYLLKTICNCWCSAKIQGQKRRITVSILDDITYQQTMSVVHDLKTLHMQPNDQPPTVLVLESHSLGVTSFCHILVNHIINIGQSPMFVDFDICRNSNTLPGAISIAEIVSDQHFNSLGFSYLNRHVLYFGDFKFSHDNKQLYYFLIRRMGALLHSTRNCSSMRNSGAVLYLHGFLTSNPQAIECILESFNVTCVVFIGENEFYQKLKCALFKKVPSKFICQPQDAIPRNELLERSDMNQVIRNYFYGTITQPKFPKHFEVNLHDINIYRIFTTASDEYKTDITINEFGFEIVPCNSSIESAVLAVSKIESFDIRNPTVDVMEIKYFVCIVRVLDNGTAVVLSPNEEITRGGVLLIGDITMPSD